MNREPGVPAPNESQPGAVLPAVPAPARPGARFHGFALLAALILLAVASVALYGRTVTNTLFGSSATTGSQLSYVTDLDFWQRTPRESTVEAVTRFDLDHNLEEVPLQVGDWQGQVRPETNQEVMILLQPEQYVQRLYWNHENQYLWLTMVGGRSSQPFHAPDICYDADGWQYRLGSHAVMLEGGGSVYGLYLDAHKEVPDPKQAGVTQRQEHVVFYFYLFPDSGRALSDGIVLFKLTSPRLETIEETLALHDDFVRQFFHSARPGTLQADRPLFAL